MYYSKGGTAEIPRNYSGNAFRRNEGESFIAEYSPTVSERGPNLFDDRSNRGESEDFAESSENFGAREDRAATDERRTDALPALLSDISAEDILLLGLIFLIHRDNPTDSTLLLLLVLLLVK